MNFFNKETPLKVWHLIVIFLGAAIIYFVFSTWNQVRVNKINITTLANYLQQNQKNQTQIQPQRTPPMPEVKEKTNKTGE